MKLYNSLSVTAAKYKVMCTAVMVCCGCVIHVAGQTKPVTVEPPRPPYKTFAPDQGHMVDSCTFDWNGNVYNLWPIGGGLNNPRFQDKRSRTPAEDHGLYTFDPCYSFTHGDCRNSMVCRTDEAGEDVSIGLADTTTFVYSVLDNAVTVQYRGRQEIDPTVKPVFTNVVLICDKGLYEPSLEILGDTTPGEFRMELKHRCCCANECPPNVGPSAKKGLSFGSWLCILFFIAVFIYLVGGMLYMKVVRGASGIEVIPHLAFWQDFPNLVVDGVNYVCTCGRGPPDPFSQRPGEGSKAEYEPI